MAALWDLPGKEGFINNLEPQGTSGRAGRGALCEYAWSFRNKRGSTASELPAPCSRSVRAKISLLISSPTLQWVFPSLDSREVCQLGPSRQTSRRALRQSRSGLELRAGWFPCVEA